jgi:hypothetical protein
LLKTTTKRRKRIRKYPYFPRFSKAKAAEKQAFKKKETMTTALDFIIKQAINRKSEAMEALVNNVDRDELSGGELLHLWQKLTVATEAGIRIWKTLDNKVAVLEALERIEDYTAYVNKMIALHGKGEAAEKAKRYFEYSEGWI